MSNEDVNVVFFLDGTSRGRPWSGSAARNGGVATSGTEQSVAVVAEELAKVPGFKCTVVSENCADGVVDRGVVYKRALDAVEWARADVVATVPWLSPPLEKMRRGARLIAWTHCPFVQSWLLDARDRHGLQVELVHPSAWCMDVVRASMAGIVPQPAHAVIPNPLMMLDCEPALGALDLDAPRPPSFVFHACYERGGAAARRVVSALGWDELAPFRVLEYDRSVPFASGADKTTLAAVLRGSKYFVYPLVLPGGSVHLDTFACCVAEALLQGVHVVTYRAGALFETYGDAVHWVDGPLDGAYMNSEASAQRIADVVRRVEAMSAAEDRNWRVRGRARVASLYSPAVVGAAWRALLTPAAQPTHLHSQPTCTTHPHSEHLLEMSNRRCIPGAHVAYLQRLKASGFEPKVVYDIGACVLHWTNEARRLWPDATYVLFDAFDKAEFLYASSPHASTYHVGVLSDTDEREVHFFQNDLLPGGNSYYREVGCEGGKYFPDNTARQLRAKTLATVVRERGFPLPDLVKIDVQGSERDVIAGGAGVLAHAQHLIVEMQDVEYNLGAPRAASTGPYIESLGWRCVAPKFCDNGPDADYGYVRM
jgi:FkbM family methyltransferase